MNTAVITELNAEQWLCGTFSETLSDYGITAASSESDLDIAAEEIDADARSRNICLSGTRQWLEAAHNRLVSDAENASAWATNSGV